MPPVAPTWEVKPVVQEGVRVGGGSRVGKSCWKVEKRTRTDQGPWEKASFGRDAVPAIPNTHPSSSSGLPGFLKGVDFP